MIEAIHLGRFLSFWKRYWRANHALLPEFYIVMVSKFYFTEIIYLIIRALLCFLSFIKLLSEISIHKEKKLSGWVLF